MPVTLFDAKARLEAEGLYVSHHSAQALWIAANVRDQGEEVMMSDDACSLICKSGRWVAVFPADGLCTYEMPGSLPELVSVISTVYDQYRRGGGPFKDAFRQAVSGADRFIVGRSTVAATRA